MLWGFYKEYIGKDVFGFDKKDSESVYGGGGGSERLKEMAISTPISSDLVLISLTDTAANIVLKTEIKVSSYKTVISKKMENE